MPRSLTRWTTSLACAVLLACALAAGCSGSDDPSSADDDAALTDGQLAVCGPAELCTRTIGECEIDMTLAQCEGWYANPSSCADIAAYTECNCNCIEAPGCGEYFACGEVCFEDYC